MFGISVPQYFIPQQISAQNSFGTGNFDPNGGGAQNAANIAQSNYMRNVVNPQVSGVTSGFGARGIGGSSFAGAFAAAAQADGAANASQVGQDAANAYANRTGTLMQASLAPGQLGVNQQNANTDQTRASNQYQLGLLDYGLKQQQQQYNQNYNNAMFGLGLANGIANGFGGSFGGGPTF